MDAGVRLWAELCSDDWAELCVGASAEAAKRELWQQAERSRMANKTAKKGLRMVETG